MLDGAERVITTSFPNLELSTHLVAGDPGWAVVTASEHALLTVVGHRGRGHVIGGLIGSVAQHVAAQGCSPVAVIPPSASLDAAKSGGPILVGVDETDSCEAAIGYAFDEATRRGADLIAALVVNDAVVPPFVRGPARAGSQQDEDEHALLARQLDGWSEKYPSVAAAWVRSLIDRSTNNSLVP